MDVRVSIGSRGVTVSRTFMAGFDVDTLGCIIHRANFVCLPSALGFSDWCKAKRNEGTAY